MEYMLLGLVVVFGLMQLVIVALAMWVGYRLAVIAIRTAILEADDERARRAAAGSFERQQ